MRNRIAALPPALAHPLAAGTLAALIVLGMAGMFASKLVVRQPQIAFDSQVEHVMVAQPKLEVNAPQAAARAIGHAVKTSPAAAGFAQPQIARTGRMSLFVGNVDGAVSALSRLVRSQQGDVFALNVDHGDTGSMQPSADMTLRVPADRFDETMRSAVRLGSLRERSVSAEDLTTAITDSSAHLRNLRRTEEDIRHIMDRSGTVGEVLDAENQLSQVRDQIETLQSDVKSMQGRVSYATIDILLQAEASAAPVEPSAASQLTGAWRAAMHQIGELTIGILAAALWIAVFAPFLLLAFLAGYFVFRRLSQASRSHA